MRLRYALTFHAIFVSLALYLTADRPLRAESHDCALLNVPGTPSGINNAGVIVGSANGHGFVRDSAGNITTVDYPGTTSGTRLFAINNNGVITGQSGSTFGFFTLDLAGNFKPITLPPPYDSDSLLSIYGINDEGAILFSSWQESFSLILKPDGSVIEVGAYGFAGALNNSYQFLAIGDGYGSPARLVNSDGTMIPIQWKHPKSFWSTVARGLNNLGDVVGYVSTYVKSPLSPPWSGFVRNASGSFSALDCAGLTDIMPQLINDNGVVVGTSSGGPFIATPVPGTPRFQASIGSISFPTMLGVPQTSPPSSVPVNSAPIDFTVSNTGDARLDLGGPQLVGELPPYGPPYFNVSSELGSHATYGECLKQGTPVASLDPGESCVVTVRAAPFNYLVSAISTLRDTIYFEDSSSGSPHSIPVSVNVKSSAFPLCQEYSVSSGPPSQANFTMQDTTSGLASIVALESTNVALNIPAFTPGTKDVVPVSATVVDPMQPAQVDFQVTSLAVASTSCGSSFGVSQWAGLGGTFPSKIAVGRNSDGRLQAFVRGVHRGLWTTAQTAVNGHWSGWQNLGGVINGDPAVAVNADGRLEVFALGSDNSLWHISQTTPGGPWSSWDNLGGVLTSNPAAASNPDGRLQVFGLGQDHRLWTKAQTSPGGTWSDWSSLGGAGSSNPAAVVNKDGRIEVFVYGMDSSLQHLSQTIPGGDWSEWADLGGNLAGDPAPIVNRDGRLEVFGRGGDSQLWHIFQTAAGGTWSEWIPQGGVITTDPAVIANADGRLEVFARGTHLGLWHLAQTAAGANWSDWESLGGVLADAVSAAMNLDGRVVVLVAGSNQSLWLLEQGAPGFWK